MIFEVNDNLKLVLYVLQICLQLFAISVAVIAIKKNKFLDKGNFWSWFIAGFTFQLIRRILAIVWLYGIEFPADIKTVTLAIVPTCVSICYAIAMYKAYIYMRQKTRQYKNLSNNYKRLKELSDKI